MRVAALLLAPLLWCATPVGRATVAQAPPHPARLVPDTRWVSQYLWAEQPKQAVRALWMRSQVSRLEEGGCAYGYFPDSTRLVVVTITPPHSIQQQGSEGIAFRCELTPHYLGPVHTHVAGERCVSPIDFAGVIRTEAAIGILVWGPNAVSIATRDFAINAVLIPEHREAEWQGISFRCPWIILGMGR